MLAWWLPHEFLSAKFCRSIPAGGLFFGFPAGFFLAFLDPLS